MQILEAIRFFITSVNQFRNDKGLPFSPMIITRLAFIGTLELLGYTVEPDGRQTFYTARYFFDTGEVIIFQFKREETHEGIKIDESIIDDNPKVQKLMIDKSVEYLYNLCKEDYEDPEYIRADLDIIFMMDYNEGSDCRYICKLRNDNQKLVEVAESRDDGDMDITIYTMDEFINVTKSFGYLKPNL